MIKIHFPIDPVPKARPRFTKFGHAFTPIKTREFETKIKHIARHQIPKNYFYDRVPIHLELVFNIKMPKHPRNEYPKGDWDNYAKAVCDSLNGLLWRDDVQIISCHTTKSYAVEPGIELTAWP